MRFKKITSEKFKYFYSKVPRLCVEVVVKNDKGVLLTKRIIPPYQGYWHLPGGTVMYGESLKDAVKRIAKAELGVEVEVIKPYLPLEWPKEKYPGNHTVSIPYLVKINKGEIKLDFQASEFEFFKKVPNKTIKEHKEFINQNI